MKQSRAGFSLIELVVVMLIMAILAAVAAPGFMDHVCECRVEAAARRIAADINHVRARAKLMGQTEDEWIRFYPANENYELVDDPDPDRPRSEYWVDFDKAGYSVDLVSVAFENELGETSNTLIRFDLYGRARCGNGTIAPLTSGEIVVASGDLQRIVVVDPVTGKASVQ